MKNRRFLCLLLVTLVTPTFIACGGDDEEATKAAAPKLSGTYRPVDQGPVSSVTFSGNADYLLMPSGCSGAACAEIGTYRFDSAARLIVLENAATRQTRSLPLQIVKTEAAASSSTSLVKSLRPLELVDRGVDLGAGGGNLTNGGGSQGLGTPGAGLNTGGVSQVLELVLQIIMQGQQLVRDIKGGGERAGGGGPQDQDDDTKPDDQNPVKNPLDCSQGVPTAASTPQEALAYFARCPNGP